MPLHHIRSTYLFITVVRSFDRRHFPFTQHLTTRQTKFEEKKEKLALIGITLTERRALPRL